MKYMSLPRFLKDTEEVPSFLFVTFSHLFPEKL